MVPALESSEALFKSHTVDIQPGEDFGIKSGTLSVTCARIYSRLMDIYRTPERGWAQAGAYLAVRPQTRDRRQHCALSLVLVLSLPKIADSAPIEINPADPWRSTHCRVAQGRANVHNSKLPFGFCISQVESVVALPSRAPPWAQSRVGDENAEGLALRIEQDKTRRNRDLAIRRKGRYSLGRSTCNSLLTELFSNRTNGAISRNTWRGNEQCPKPLMDGEIDIMSHPAKLRWVIQAN